MTGRDGATWPQVQGCLEPPEAGSGRKDPPLAPLEGARPRPHQDLRLWSGAGREHVAVGKPPSSGPLMVAAPGNHRGHPCLYLCSLYQTNTCTVTALHLRKPIRGTDGGQNTVTGQAGEERCPISQQTHRTFGSFQRATPHEVKRMWLLLSFLLGNLRPGARDLRTGQSQAECLGAWCHSEPGALPITLPGK